jgi:pyridoxal phosphate enzyme (YggS family)
MLIGPQNSPPAAELARRYRALRSRISAAATAAGRNEDCVTLLAVSKGRSAAAVQALAQLGVEHFGENYLQEALPKLAALAGMELAWHYIGRLQANKTRAIAEHFAWVHSVDRERTAERLAAQRPHFAAPLNVCLQVRLAASGDRSGAEAAQIPSLAAAVAALPRLRLRGLMCMLPEGLEPAQQRARFAEVRALHDALNRGGAGLDTLSMGMSGDFEAAIACGSTMVRIGSALFGPLPKPGDL